MLAVLQTNGLRRASNKNVLGLSLLANTLLFYEEKPGGRIELLQKACWLAHLYHASWLYRETFFSFCVQNYLHVVSIRGTG